MNRTEFRTRWRLSKDDFTNKQVDMIQKIVEHESLRFQIEIVKKAINLVCGPRVVR